MPPETMKLILVLCTIILATHAEVQDYELTRGSDDQTPLLRQLLRRHVRSDSMDIEARRRSALDKNFMRFGRADKNILRFGRSSSPNNILRFGRSGENFIRFGRNDGNFMRFGRNDDQASHTRLGRPDNNFIRFGRTSEYINSPVEETERGKKSKDMGMEWNDGKHGENFMRFGRNQDTNFLRLGRPEDKGGTKHDTQTKNILRFGRSENFMRFGRSGNAQNAEESPTEEVPESLENVLTEDDMLFPPNYLIPREDDN